MGTRETNAVDGASDIMAAAKTPDLLVFAWDGETVCHWHGNVHYRWLFHFHYRRPRLRRLVG